MIQKRLGQDQDESADLSPLAAVETLRAAAAPPAEKKDDEKISIFWRVFGGTILSIAALVVITIFNNVNNTLSELRAQISREQEARAGLAKKEDLDREREARVGLAKKEDVDSRIKTQYDRIRAIEAYKADIEAVKERVGSNVAAVEAAKKELGAAVDAVRKDTGGLELLKERVAAVEAVKKEVAGLDALKERCVVTAADLKAVRDEVQKLHQEVEKNKASDLERKAFRDSQAKQLDETLKELHKGLQDCREKIARLEGAQPSGSPASKAGRTVPSKVEPAGGTRPAPKPSPDDE